MTESYPDSVHDLLCFEDPLSDSSSTGDNRLEGTSAPPRMCAMADGDPPPEVVPSEQTHTPADVQAHDKDLCRRRQTPPPGDQSLWASSGSKGMNPAGSVHRCALRVNHDIVNEARMQIPKSSVQARTSQRPRSSCRRYQSRMIRPKGTFTAR